MSVVKEQNSREDIPVQTRKTDRMLTKILHKLHRLSPSDDQKASKDVPVEENGAALAGTSDNEKV
jgi:hypothetical protein